MLSVALALRPDRRGRPQGCLVELDTPECGEFDLAASECGRSDVGGELAFQRAGRGDLDGGAWGE